MTLYSTAQRTSKYIGFRAFFDDDEDILGWWEAIPAGERSHVLRTLIRAFLTGQYTTTPSSDEPLAFTNSLQLAQVRAEMAWIRDALREMPAFLERLVGTVGSRPADVPTRPATSGNGSGEQLSDERAHRKVERIKQRRW